MKRAGPLLEAIAEPGNLRLAFWKAARGKWAQADCRQVLDRFGVAANGLEPRDPRPACAVPPGAAGRPACAVPPGAAGRGQLEQRRPEVPVGVPQQQLAGQPEQQPWVPPRAGPSST